MDISVLEPLNPSFLLKCTGNRFAFHRPTRPYAGLLIVPLGSKVMADCHISHYPSPSFFGGLTYCMTYCMALFCPDIQQKLCYLCSHHRNGSIQLLALSQLMMTIHACDEHCFGCSNMLLLALNACSFGWLLHHREMVPDELTTCSVLCNRLSC